MLHHSCTPNHGVCHHCLGSLPTLCRIAINWNRSSDVLLRLHATGTYSQCDGNDERFKWESLKTRRNNQRLTMFYRICNITWCLLLQLIILFRFCGGTAEDRVMTKCIKFLTLGPISTSTLSSQQQLYACGTLYLHL